MLGKLQILFSIFSVVLGVYGLVTDSVEIMPYMFFCLGITFLIIGISEFKENRKPYATIHFLTSSFIIFVAFYTFFS
ncbi:DUF3953 domain-containing protein [Bacillus cereus]|uniref:DUF3953 domain-containing protein n=1 Tax=Bacillus cereus TaxID=1396 RepID=UPI0009BFFD61|nr:DUF3953 domain-containing protein [Bacillus cereus]